jgi:hypothetical protein
MGKLTIVNAFSVRRRFRAHIECMKAVKPEDSICTSKVLELS